MEHEGKQPKLKKSAMELGKAVWLYPLLVTPQLN